MEEKCVKRFDRVEGSFTLESDKEFNIDKLLKIFGVDISGKPDSYIQEGIDYTSFHTIISPVTRIGTRGLYVINSYDDIRCPKNALEYYNR